MADRKPCKDCGSYTRKVTPPGPRCATCHREEKKRMSKAAHDRRAVNGFGLKPGEYDKLLAAQGGVCYLCRRAKGLKRRLAIDHDHACCPGKTSCGKCVRGLLCSPCNDVLAIARDETGYFQRAITYLMYPPARSVLSAHLSPVSEGREGDGGGEVVQAPQGRPKVRRVGDAIPGVDEYADGLARIIKPPRHDDGHDA